MEKAVVYAYADGYVINPNPTAAPTTAPTIAPTEKPVVRPDGYKYPYRVTDCSLSDKTAEITAECYENTDAVTMIYAGYDNDGKLVGVEIKTPAVLRGERFKESFARMGERFKVFIWNMNTLQPYAQVYESIDNYNR